MKRRSTADMPCSIAKAVDVLGDPWTMLIVRDALLGVEQFEVWVRRLEIPRATLTARLDHLVRHGVLVRSEGRYRLTDKGRALQPVTIALMQWGDAWQRTDRPPTTFVDATSGAAVEPVMCDRHTGRPLAELHVRAVGPVVEGIGTHAP
jgi:DNA-binding HxlR family transcriptional regulator